MQVVQTPTFKKQIKKLHKNQKIILDQTILKILENPAIGQMKKGDLEAVRVYKFQMINQLTLLAYEVFESDLRLILLALGTHENFYRDLKKK